MGGGVKVNTLYRELDPEIRRTIIPNRVLVSGERPRCCQTKTGAEAPVTHRCRCLSQEAPYSLNEGRAGRPGEDYSP